jgi:biopolymer transport protein ExbD
MKIARPPRRTDSDANLIPLINVVFLLIIFFMLAGTFARPDMFDVTPPVSQSADTPDENTLVVLVSASGRIAVGEQDFNLDQLRAKIIERVQANPELHVQLKADEQLPAVQLIDLMDMFRETGLKRLTLLTLGQKT